MIIKRIFLKDFKNFKTKEVFFDKMTFIKGKNGSGKTTLALESVLFGIYGYTPKESLKDLPTRNMAKSCSVEIEVEDKGKTYTIIRAYPTKLTVKEDGVELKFASNREAQNYLDTLFGDRLNFMKFRMIDAYTKETNFLDEGQTALKKIIFSSSEDLINNMRKKLTEIKHEREIFNKDKAVIYKHHPSEKRLKALTDGISVLEKQNSGILSELRDFERELSDIQRAIGKLEGEKGFVTSKRDKILKYPKCYACEQPISEERQKSILAETEKVLETSNKKITEKTPDIKMLQEIISSKKKARDIVSSKINGLRTLKMKLSARLQQKEYKYTSKDVLIAKTAIGELDRLSTYYLTETIRILEPIINDILTKIEFEVKFNIDEKGKFRINLIKDNIEYKYKDLSTGQKLILQIAFKLSLLLERAESGVIVADEGLGSLDEENLTHVLNIFENLPFQLLMILHNAPEFGQNIKVIDLNETVS